MVTLRFLWIATDKGGKIFRGIRTALQDDKRV